MDYLLGIDGGGTHTTAWLADARLSVLARVETGPSNPIKVGTTSAQRELGRAYHAALREAHVHRDQLGAVCAGLAGGNSARVHQNMLSWLRKSIPARAHLLTTDAMIALTAALGESEGIIVIAGTGSIAYGRGPSGRILRAGGWGNLFDDTGSGYDIGRKAVACALRAFDGRDKRTGLADSICRQLRLKNITEIVAKPVAAQNIAGLFPLVQKAARAGDRVARKLCHEAAADLADLALSLIAQFKWNGQSVPVICSGGVFQSSPVILRRFAQRIRERVPGTRISLLRCEPVEGALFLASKLAQQQAVKLKASRESSRDSKS